MNMRMHNRLPSHFTTVYSNIETLHRGITFKDFIFQHQKQSLCIAPLNIRHLEVVNNMPLRHNQVMAICYRIFVENSENSAMLHNQSLVSITQAKRAIFFMRINHQPSPKVPAPVAGKPHRALFPGANGYIQSRPKAHLLAVIR